MMLLHEFCSNEKQVSGLMLRIFQLHSAKRNITFRASNDMHQLLHPLPPGLFVLWMYNENTQRSTPCLKLSSLSFKSFIFTTCTAGKCAYVTTDISIFVRASKWKTGYDQNAVETWRVKRGVVFFCAAPLSLDHIQVHLPRQGGSNGAPWPGLCALLSVLWKSPKDSRKTHFNPRCWHPSIPWHRRLRPVSSAQQQHGGSQSQRLI